MGQNKVRTQPDPKRPTAPKQKKLFTRSPEPKKGRKSARYNPVISGNNSVGHICDFFEIFFNKYFKKIIR